MVHQSRAGILKKAALVFAGLAAAALPAGAVFTRGQLDVIDSEPLFDSEYFADLLGFSPPLAWESLWRGSTTAYRNNGASLDCCELLWQQDLKYEALLTPGLIFKFRLERNEDKDRSDLHHWLEFEQNLPQGFSVSLFGEPAKDKEDADIGLGLAWRQRSLKLSARHTFVDFTFNKRGDKSLRYDRMPAADEVRLDFSVADSTQYWLSLKLDHPTRLRHLTQGKTESYRRTLAKAGSRVVWAPNLRTTLEYGYDFLKKASLRSPDPGLLSEDFRRQAHRVFAAAETDLSEYDALEFGNILMIRGARNDSPAAPDRGIFYERWEYQPYARWRRSIPPRIETECAAFLSMGANRKRRPGGQAPSVNQTIIEAKLGAGVDWVFTPKARLGLYSNFDLDDLHRHAWDGGAVRVIFLF